MSSEGRVYDLVSGESKQVKVTLLKSMLIVCP